LKFFGGRLSRGGHACAFGIGLDEVLKGDGAEYCPSRLYGKAFFGFEGGLKAIGPSPIWSNPSGEFVDDVDLLIAHNVVDVSVNE